MHKSACLSSLAAQLPATPNRIYQLSDLQEHGNMADPYNTISTGDNSTNMRTSTT